MWGVELSPLSQLVVILSIGLSVDYTAHVCYHFYISDHGLCTLYCQNNSFAVVSQHADHIHSTRATLLHLRLHDTLESIALPMLQGGICLVSMVSLLAFVPLGMCHVFVKIIVLCVSLGLIHGLVVLPVLMVAMNRPWRGRVSMVRPEKVAKEILETVMEGKERPETVMEATERDGKGEVIVTRL
jgi:hypothetical protein